MKLLSDVFDNPFARKALNAIELPDYIGANLSHTIHPYQQEAFRRFIYAGTTDDLGLERPLHLLFNMATGSGKTLIMAGLVLYLYKNGYRNFVFFVSSENIIRKTRDNFLNAHSSKYLFAPQIVLDGRQVFLKETDNFQYADADNINIRFTTIQKLHSDLATARENGITYEDFRDKKFVLLSDEAHHMNTATRKQAEIAESWEGTVLKIQSQHTENVLLEFTATMDYDNPEIYRKYAGKVLFRYGLAEFRNDRYSKEISLVRSLYDQDQRILQALVLNLYRQELANANRIDMKPVILFKARKTISESERNKTGFHRQIDSLDESAIDELRATSTVPVVQKAFAFFDRAGKTSAGVARTLRSMFRPENCISANDDHDLTELRQRLNTLDEPSNPVRAVFAVHKLNEGWDVLNLFDIVRLYEGQNSGGSNTKPAATTLSEAQLIGRGARYFPFDGAPGHDRYRRKFDNDTENDLRILEELYYHTKEDSRYISELKKVLIASGIYVDEERLVTRTLKVKDEFRATDFYLNKQLFANRRVEKSYGHIKSIRDFGVSKVNFNFALSSGDGFSSGIFSDETHHLAQMQQKDVKLRHMPAHIIRYALSQQPFFRFDNLKSKMACFPNLLSMAEFVSSEDYLGGLGVTFYGIPERLAAISNRDCISALHYVLKEIEKEVLKNYTRFEGSAMAGIPVRSIVADKNLRVEKGSEREDGQEELLGGERWYAQNANFGTAQEKDFVRMFKRVFDDSEAVFDEFHVIRNERFLKIFNETGRAFEPDFILSCRKKDAPGKYYQVFMEPKGEFLVEKDKWKEDFMQRLRNEEVHISVKSDTYIVTAVPVFYTRENENEFIGQLKKTLSIS